MASDYFYWWKIHLVQLLLRSDKLHLEIQFPRRGKEEVENWQQSIRYPSVSVEYLCVFLVIIELMF